MRANSGSLGSVAIALGVSFVLTNGAEADFIGWSVSVVYVDEGHYAFNVFAQFSNAGDRILNVFNTEISTTHAGGFYQSAANPFWKAANTQNVRTSNDSWVCIGTNPNGSGNAGGNGGSVVADPNFVNFEDNNDSTDFSFIESAPDSGGAGWYNSNPTQNEYGYAFQQNRVYVAHLVLAQPILGDDIYWKASATIVRPGVAGSMEVTGAEHWSWFPAPGTVFLLPLAGLILRSRCRRQPG